MRPRRYRHHPTSPPATLPDDEDLLAEILLRLPPRPRSLPCAAAVCKSWHRVITDRRFLRRFRARHGTPPLLGFFDPYGRFFPTLKAPDRVPSARLSGYWDIVACRDGLVLCSRGSKLQVLDLLTGDRSSTISTREAKLPVTLKVELAIDSTAVDRLRFHLFALCTDAGYTRLSASVYSSDSGAWTHSVDTLVLGYTIGFMQSLGTLVGNTFYWFHKDVGIILCCDLGTQALTTIQVPRNEEGGYEYNCRYLFMTKDGLLCTIMLDRYEHTIQFWVRDTVHSRAAKWVLRKTVMLGIPLPRKVRLNWPKLKIVWFEEENNVISLRTDKGIFKFNLESMKCMKASEETCCDKIYPYSSFMTADRVVGLLPVDEVHGS